MKAGSLCRPLYIFLVVFLGQLDPSVGQANVNNVPDRVSLLEKKLQDLTVRYEKTAAELASLRSNQAEEVYFEVQLLNNQSSVADNTTLVFDAVLYNKGEGYDNNTGKFIAPTSGTYLFWCYVVVNDKDYLQIYLYKNGELGASGYAPHHRRFRVASKTSVFPLNEGDQVWVMKKGSASLRGDGMSNFGGVLLPRMVYRSSNFDKNVKKTDDCVKCGTGGGPSLFTGLSVFMPLLIVSLWSFHW